MSGVVTGSAVAKEPVGAILVTVGAWDLAPAWLAHLSESGRIVFPLRTNGITQVIGFRREGDHLVGASAEVSGFVPMQGKVPTTNWSCCYPTTTATTSSPTSKWTCRPTSACWTGVLASERTEMWSGITIKHGVSFADLHLWFAAYLPGLCKLAVDEGTALAAECKGWFPFGAVHRDSFAYLSIRPMPEGGGVEFGARSWKRERGWTTPRSKLAANMIDG